MEIHIGDRIADVTLVSKEGNKVQFLIDGKPYDVDIVMAENGSCSILHDGNSFNAELIRGEGGKSYDVNMFYRSYHVDIVDTQTKYLRMKKGGEEKQDDRIIAPMPGKVVKIPVQKGDRLSAGDIVVVLEAMKMQSNYKVSSDCVVKDILVQDSHTFGDMGLAPTIFSSISRSVSMDSSSFTLQLSSLSASRISLACSNVRSSSIPSNLKSLCFAIATQIS